MNTNWITGKLEDVATVISGGTPKSHIKEYWNGNIQWLTPANMNKVSGNYISKTERTITQKGLVKSSAKLIPGNSVILSCRAPIGHLKINREPITTNQGCKGIVPINEKLDSEYLFYNLLMRVDELNKLGTGATFKELSASNLKNLSISYPSIEKQRKIVSKLDQAFEAIDQAIANTEKNIDNLEELFQSQLSHEINQFENNELVSWNTHVEIRSGRGQKEVEDDNGKYPIVGSAGKTMGYANDYISEENSIIIGRKGTINKPIFMHSKYWNVDTGFGLHALNGLQPEYLFLFCLNYDFTKHDKGSGRPSLVKRDLLKIEMNLPSESEQTQCIERVKAFKEYHDSLKKSFSLKIKNFEDLKMSILERAFKGELV